MRMLLSRFHCSSGHHDVEASVCKFECNISANAAGCAGYEGDSALEAAHGQVCRVLSRCTSCPIMTNLVPTLRNENGAMIVGLVSLGLGQVSVTKLVAL